MSTYQAGEAFPRPCPECGGTRIVARVGEADLRRQVVRPPSAFCYLFAVVCLHCGQTTLFADDLKALRQQLEKHPRDFQEAAQSLQQQQEARGC